MKGMGLFLVHSCGSYVLVGLFFFFSSRRRHTRCYRDWSSDVCSSDLTDERGQPGRGTARPPSELPGHGKKTIGSERGTAVRRNTRTFGAHRLRRADRSEERRVGKEGRWRGLRKYEKRRGTGTERSGAA